VLEPVVLLDRRGVREMHSKTRCLQPVNEPVPVEGPIEIFL
jgi:hypothetical protein